MARFLIFGDSIAYGCWDKEGGWTVRLRKYLDEIYFSNQKESESYRVYNLAIDGSTTQEVLTRVEFEIQQIRFETDKQFVLIFAVGINDSQVITSDNSPRVEEKEFKNNIMKLINIGTKNSAKIIFLGLNPIDETKVNPMPWAPDRSYRNKSVEKYNSIIKLICQEQGVYFINVNEKFKNLDYKKLLDDGAHPNSEGHKKIFEIVRDFLIEKKII